MEKTEAYWENKIKEALRGKSQWLTHAEVMWAAGALPFHGIQADLALRELEREEAVVATRATNGFSQYALADKEHWWPEISRVLGGAPVGLTVGEIRASLPRSHLYSMDEVLEALLALQQRGTVWSRMNESGERAWALAASPPPTPQPKLLGPEWDKAVTDALLQSDWPLTRDEIDANVASPQPGKEARVDRALDALEAAGAIVSRVMPISHSRVFALPRSEHWWHVVPEALRGATKPLSYSELYQALKKAVRYSEPELRQALLKLEERGEIESEEDGARYCRVWRLPRRVFAVEDPRRAPIEKKIKFARWLLDQMAAAAARDHEDEGVAFFASSLVLLFECK
jgi:hypothetical protein